MKKISSLTGKELKWTQPKAMKMEFELHAGGELVATLRFRSSFGSFATAETASGSWTFKRVGLFRTYVTVRRPDDDNNVAIFKNSTWKGGGSLEMLGGRTFPATTNLWLTKYTFNAPSGEPLVEFKTSGMVHLSAEVDIRPQAAQLPELPLIITLGWYLAVMMKNDSAGASAAAAG